MRVNRTHATKRVVMEVIGVSFLPRSIINRELLEGHQASTTLIEEPTAGLCVVYKYDHEMESEFVDFIVRYH